MEAYCFRCDDMHQRTTLNPWENGFVDLFCILLLAQNQTASWPAQSFVCSSRNKVCILYWVWMQPCGYQTGDMRHIHHQVCTHSVSNFTEFFEIQHTRICTGARYDEFWFYFLGPRHHLIIVDYLCTFFYTVFLEIKIFPRNIYWTPMGQMAAMAQIHAQHSIAGLQHRKIYCGVGIGAGMGLYIGMFCAE